MSRIGAPRRIIEIEPIEEPAAEPVKVPKPSRCPNVSRLKLVLTPMRGYRKWDVSGGHLVSCYNQVWPLRAGPRLPARAAPARACPFRPGPGTATLRARAVACTPGAPPNSSSASTGC